MTFFFLLFEYTPCSLLLPLLYRSSCRLFIAYNYTICFNVFYLRNPTFHGSPLVRVYRMDILQQLMIDTNLESRMLLL